MATHSSILAWRISRAEEPGRPDHEESNTTDRLSSHTILWPWPWRLPSSPLSAACGGCLPASRLLRAASVLCCSPDPMAQGPRPHLHFCISLRVWAKSRCSFHLEKYEYCVVFHGEPVAMPWAAHPPPHHRNLGWVGNSFVNSSNDGEVTFLKKSIKCLL